MSRDAWPHPLEVTIQYLLLYGPSYLDLFERYSSLKNPTFWLALRFLDHNARTRFFPNILFLQKVKGPLTLSCWSKKSYIIWVDMIFAKNLIFGTFWALWAHLNFYYSKTRICHFSYFPMSNFIEKNLGWLSN